MFSKLEAAQIIWQGDAPFNTEFQDVYFSPAGGYAETQDVFIAGNDLPARWQGRTHFTIAETGFGTGLNFLITLQQWAQFAPADARLSYLSIESKPLKKADLARALDAWPTLREQAQALLAAYPELVSGFHRRCFLNQQISLTLIFADVEEAFNAITPGGVDAWYLDGFAPSRNPQMWQETLFKKMAQLSAAGATYSTFTAAGAVRRGLEKAGFSVEKKPGFAGKRQRIQGELLSPQTPVVSVPWFSLAKSVPSQALRDVIVIGGGISGIALAHNLVQRGWQVTLLERHGQLAAEGSGNLAGVVMPRLEAAMGMAGQYFLTAFLYTLRWLDAVCEQMPAAPWLKSGVVALCNDENRLAKFAAYGLPPSVLQCVSAQAAAALSGLPLQQGGLYFPQAGYLDPAALIQSLAKLMPGLRLAYERRVEAMAYKDGQWHVRCATTEEYTASHIVLANAYDAMRLLADDYLVLSNVRGQLSYLPDDALAFALKKPVIAEGYIIPAYQGRYCLGATYHHDDSCAALRDTDHRSNLAAIAAWLAHDIGDLGKLAGRVAWRAMTRDHLPYVGPAPDVPFYRREYSDLNYGRRVSKYASGEYHPGLWLLTGMGSRGLVSAPYCAEVLADMMEGVPLAAPLAMMQALHPARRLVQMLKRGLAFSG